jgi:hypothetical protein
LRYQAFFSIFLLLLGFSLGATQVYDLPDLLNPHTLTVEGDDLYITGRSQVYVYRFPDQLRKVFGKKGEGPGEFREYFDQGLWVSLDADRICVCSNGRVSYFTRNFKFIEEKKTGTGHSFIMVDDGLVGIRFATEGNIAYNRVVLLNDRQQTAKVLQPKKHWYQPGKDINPVNVRNPRYCVSGDFIYAEAEDGIIHIYDYSGNSVGTVRANYTLVEVSEEDRQIFHEYYRTHPYYRERYHELKHLIQFPRYYPPVKFFDCDGETLLVMTHVRQDGANEIYLFTGRGEFLKKGFLAMPDIPLAEVNPIIRVANGRMYQLLENPGEEIWQLHVTPLNLQ